MIKKHKVKKKVWKSKTRIEPDEPKIPRLPKKVTRAVFLAFLVVFAAILMNLIVRKSFF